MAEITVKVIVTDGNETLTSETTVSDDLVSAAPEVQTAAMIAVGSGAVANYRKIVNA